MSKAKVMFYLIVMGLLVLSSSAHAEGGITDPLVIHESSEVAWFVNPLRPVEEDNVGTPIAVEGMVSYEEDEMLEHAYIVTDEGFIYQKTTSDLNGQDWERIYGGENVIDIGANAGEVWAVTATKRVLRLGEVNGIPTFIHVEPPVDQTQTPLALARVDVDQRGNPWVVTEEAREVFTLVDGQWIPKSIQVCLQSTCVPLPVEDLACGGSHNLYITTSVPALNKYNCLVIYNDNDTEFMPLAHHCGLSDEQIEAGQGANGVINIDGPIDVDNNGVIWMAATWKKMKLSGQIVEHPALYKGYWPTSEGIHLEASYDGPIRDVGAQ